MLQLKKIISSRSKVISNFLCPYHCYLWGKCKDLNGAVFTIKVSKNGDGNANDGELIRASLFSKGLLTKPFLVGVSVVHKLVNFINLLLLNNY